MVPADSWESERVRRGKELPTFPDMVANPSQAAAYAVAARIRRGRHGQLCPVWTRRAGLDACDCWIMEEAAGYAQIAVAAYLAAERIAEGSRN